MKRLFLLLLISLFAFEISADVVNDARKVSIRAVLPEDTDMPKEAASQLCDKLKRIITSTGLTDNGLTNRFIFTSKVNVIGKDVVPTTPVKVSVKLDITFYIGDIIENKVYESTSVEVSGIGINENKAYIDAIKKISASNKNLRECLLIGKQKIAEYYAAECNTILQEADRLAKQGMYKSAIAELVAVPDVCENCYRITRQKAVEINDEFMDVEGLTLIKEAKAAWMQKQDYAGAATALDLLSQVNPLARCSQQADDLMQKINDKLRTDEAIAAAERAEKERRNWEFQMQRYRDNMEMARVREANKTMLMTRLINAAENVGCAYAAHQPKIVHNVNLVRIW